MIWGKVALDESDIVHRFTQNPRNTVLEVCLQVMKTFPFNFVHIYIPFIPPPLVTHPLSCLSHTQLSLFASGIEEELSFWRHEGSFEEGF